MSEHTYIAIDLKSFYASVECAERHLDPLTTNLVVADRSRTEKTICLAVSPSLKAFGIPGRARLFEVVQRVKEINAARILNAPSGVFSASSFDDQALKKDPSLELSYITAPPRMHTYMDYSSRIYGIYLKYIAPEDIHVYSIDEVFIDATQYLKLYKMTARELCMTMIREVLYTTGITATGGIGTNLYLSKIAMDIVAKHIPADRDGVRIAHLDEVSYRKLLWTHEPLTDFWRVGGGISRKLRKYGLYTMGDIARCSLGKETDYYNEDLLYRLFGVNAQLLIDHAWGYEPVTIDQIRQYRPENNSLSSGQVLQCPYEQEKARIVLREMTDQLSLDLVSKNLVTDQLVLHIGYDIENLTGTRSGTYCGAIVTDHYGRSVPKPAHGSVRLGPHTSGSALMIQKALELFDRITDPSLLIRRINIAACHVMAPQQADMARQAREQQQDRSGTYRQMDLFTDFGLNAEEDDRKEQQARAEAHRRAQELKLQQAMLSIRERYGKNAVLKGTSFQEGATARERNGQVGGHKG